MTTDERPPPRRAGRLTWIVRLFAGAMAAIALLGAAAVVWGASSANPDAVLFGVGTVVLGGALALSLVWAARDVG